MLLTEIAAIPTLPLSEALELIDRHFDTTVLASRPVSPRTVEDYYRQSDRGYRLFHSREGALHIALGCDGHRDRDGFCRQAELFREQLDLLDAHHAIEVGCGMGYNVRWLAKESPQRTFLGLDLTESHVRFAIKHAKDLPNAQFVVGDYESLTYPENSFEAALAVETMCQTTHLQQALHEMSRVLRPGGRLVNIDCFRGDLDNQDADTQRAASLVEKSTAVNAFTTADEWTAMAAESGLHHIETRDLSDETGENLRRLHSLAERYFRMPAALKAASRAFPARMLENSICGLLMPYTVGAEAHRYQMIVVEKPQ